MLDFFQKQEDGEAEHIERILQRTNEPPLFKGGALVTSPKIVRELTFEDIGLLLRLHDHGFWGKVPQMVVLQNNHIVAGERQGQIVGRYEWADNEIMIVTEGVGTKGCQTKMYFVRDDMVIP
jgi:hypothetical protein